MRHIFTIMSPLFDAAGDGGSGGGTGDGSTGAGASGQQQTGGQQASGTSSGQQSGQGTQSSTPNGDQSRTGAQSGNGSQFDPKDFIPRHRFNEVSTQNQTLKSQVEDLNRRLTLALGGELSDPEAQKAAAVAEAFFKLPGMDRLRRFVDLSDEQIESLLEAPQHVGAGRAQELRQWQRHGNQVVDTISERVASTFGAEALSDDQKADLRDTFSSFIKKRAQAELNAAVERYGLDAVQQDERKFSPTIRAYEDGDQKLIDEFVTRYSKNWVEPARRSAAARTSTRTRPTPDGSGRNAPASSVKRPEKFNSLEDRIAYAAEIYKERGGVFDR